MNQMFYFKYDLLQEVNCPTNWAVNNSLYVQ